MPASSHFQTSSVSFWASIPEPIRHEVLGRYIFRAQELFAHWHECLPDHDRLQLIVEAAMEARSLYFVATMTEPSTDDLDRYFDQFVILCISGIPAINETRYED